MARSRRCPEVKGVGHARSWRFGVALALYANAVLADEPPPVPAQTDRLSAVEAELGRLREELAAERKARTQAEEDQARTREALREAVRTEARAMAADMVRRLLAEHEQKKAQEKDQAARRTGRLQVSLSGFLQADGVLYRQDSLDEVDPATGEPLNETRFLIRRARLDAEVSYRFLGGAVRFEGNTIQGPTARIIGAEAWVRWPSGPSGLSGPSGPSGPSGLLGKTSEPGRPPLVMVAIGLLKIPFGLEVPQYNADRLFLERSNVSRAFFPGDFDLGVRVHGGVRSLRYALAAMNGDPVGARGYPGRDPNQSKDFLGRLGIDVSPDRRLSVAGGVSGLYGTGFHRGTPATKDVLTWRDANGDGLVQLSELQVISGVAATPSQNFRRFALGVDLRVTATIPRLGALTLSGEILWAANLDRGLLPADPVAVGRPLRELGGYVALTQELSSYAAIGVRYDRYNPDLDARQQAGAEPVPLDSSFSTLAVAVAVRYPPWGRLTIEYDHNTNALGRTLSGLATTLGSDALTLRAQVAF
jgi:hypothetical protein